MLAVFKSTTWKSYAGLEDTVKLGYRRPATDNNERKKNLRSVNELPTWKPAEVQAWLDSVLSNKEELPKDFNWLLLAEYAGQLARRSDDLEWARVSTRV